MHDIEFVYLIKDPSSYANNKSHIVFFLVAFAEIRTRTSLFYVQNSYFPLMQY